ncbi:GAF domain-containing sensor histidine kinase [Kistimonas scapharcae]|uniref:histidine kinase n=1 Tax=Kistimonas scapharcae TaxID=1036133 RepID=A0ABP8V448_9GAMM
MSSARTPENENERLSTLLELEILDTLEEQAYDDLTELAAHICGTPIALVSLVDRDRQWFKYHHGLEARETPREYAFCAHAILQDEALVVPDSEQDPRFCDNPLVTGDPHVKFYAGMPLILNNSMPVGTLCVIDHHPRELSNIQQSALEALARQVVSQLELRLKVKALQALDNTKDNFISLVSHELRTPLTSIKGSLSLLVHNMADKMQQDANSVAGIALRNSDRLLMIVNDILDASRIDAGRLDMTLAPCHLLVLAEEAVELNQSYARECHCQVQLVSAIEQNDITVNVDKGRFMQVMSNLISNAAKFTRNSGDVIVSIESDGNTVCVSVTDQGVGIKLEDQANIFKRFPGISSEANGKLPGTGLGLNICKSIIEQMNGTIGFESSPGKGSRFYFTLPQQ